MMNFDFTNDGDYLFIEGSAYMMFIGDGDFGLAFSEDGAETAPGYITFETEDAAKSRLIALREAELNGDEDALHRLEHAQA